MNWQQARQHLLNGKRITRDIDSVGYLVQTIDKKQIIYIFRHKELASLVTIEYLDKAIPELYGDTEDWIVVE